MVEAASTTCRQNNGYVLLGGPSSLVLSANDLLKLTLMSTLVIWSLGSSEAIQDILKTMYKQQRQNDDRNQPLSVQPWGNDGDKRRYWLIEGRDDTPFRLYRESNPALKHVTWRSVAGSIEDLQQVAKKLDEDGSQASRRLRDSIQAAIPRFEAGEDVGQSQHASPIYRALTSF